MLLDVADDGSAGAAQRFGHFADGQPACGQGAQLLEAFGGALVAHVVGCGHVAAALAALAGGLWLARPGQARRFGLWLAAGAWPAERAYGVDPALTVQPACACADAGWLGLYGAVLLFVAGHECGEFLALVLAGGDGVVLQADHATCSQRW